MNKRQETLKFATPRGRQLWLIDNAQLEDVTVNEGNRPLRVKSAAQRLLLRCLADFQRDNAYAWPSQTTICDWLGGWSISKLNRTLRALKSAQLVDIGYFWNPNTQKKNARYRVVFATLSDLAGEQFDDVDHLPTAADHLPTSSDHLPTVGDRNVQSKPPISKRSNRADDDRTIDGARLARKISEKLQPRGNAQYALVRDIAERVVNRDIPEAAVFDALDAVSDHSPDRPVAYFRTVLANNWKVSL